jgi:hypothetical protein
MQVSAMAVLDTINGQTLIDHTIMSWFGQYAAVAALTKFPPSALCKLFHPIQVSGTVLEGHQLQLRSVEQRKQGPRRWYATVSFNRGQSAVWLTVCLHRLQHWILPQGICQLLLAHFAWAVQRRPSAFLNTGPNFYLLVFHIRHWICYCCPPPPLRALTGGLMAESEANSGHVFHYIFPVLDSIIGLDCIPQDCSNPASTGSGWRESP